MTYTEYTLTYLEQQEPGTPIYTKGIADSIAAVYKIGKNKAAAATAVAVKRLIDNHRINDLRFYQKGIYYRTINTPFGELGINKEKLIADKYLLPDKGYETGLHLLHNIGLTTQMTNEYMLATNVAKECLRYDNKLGVSICPPKTQVNKKNIPYLQTLDILDLIDKSPIDVQDPYLFLADYIKNNKLDYEILLFYADKYYGKNTIIKLAHTASRKEK